MPARKLTIEPLRLNAWTILSDCVERGVSYGWQRAHKYADRPSDDEIKSQIENAVMNEIAEVLCPPA